MRKTNPWITNDFLETMSEVVTPAASHALDAMHYLYAINNVLRSALAPGELLWPLSMPPKLPKDKSTIQTAKMGSVKRSLSQGIHQASRLFQGYSMWCPY